MNAESVKDPAREAGVSIEPRVERGFASETLGSRTQKMIEAREAGDSESEPTSMLVEVDRLSVARSRAYINLFDRDPRVPLAEPRYTLGFMLSPASRAGA